MIAIHTNTRPQARNRPRGKTSGFAALLRLFEQVGEFMAKTSSQAYVALGNGTPELYLVISGEAYDFELGDKLSEFAAPYIERGLLGSASLLPASSPEELAAYFDLTQAIRIERVP